MAVAHQRTHRLIAAAALAGLVLRIAFGLFYWTGKPLTHDEQEYLSLAGSLAAGRGFVYDTTLESGTGQQFGRAPGYPLLLAALGAPVAGPSGTPLVVKVTQSIIGGIGVWLIGLIALRAGGCRAGVVAAWIAAAYPPLVTLPAFVLSETIYSTLALASVAMLQRTEQDSAAKGGAIARAGLAGAVAGFAALVRPAMLFFLPLAAAWLLLRRRRAQAVVLTAAALLAIAPWTIRNVRVHGRLVLIASEGGVTFWTGNHPLAIGEGDLAANLNLKRAELQFRRDHPGLSAEELEPLYYRDAFAYIRSQPVAWMGLVARKVFYLFVPVGPSYALHSALYRAASTLPYLLVLPFALVGARRIATGARPPTALFLLAGSAVLTCLIFFPQERFRIPVIDPTLIVCASCLAGRGRPRR